MGEESLVKAPPPSSPQLASLCFWKDLTQQFSFLASARSCQQTKLPPLPGALSTCWKVWLSVLHPSQHAMHSCLPHQSAGSLNDWVPMASTVHPFATCAVFSLALGSPLSGVRPLSLGKWRLLALATCVVSLVFLSLRLPFKARCFELMTMSVAEMALEESFPQILFSFKQNESRPTRQAKSVMFNKS